MRRHVRSLYTTILWPRLSLALIAATVSLIAMAPCVYAAPIEQMIYQFNGVPDGSNPIASVVVDSGTGVVYGVATNGGASGRGVVFQLTPPAAQGGSWAESVIYSFGPDPDGRSPNSLVEDPRAGILYGTTLAGGANGGGDFI